MRSSETTNITKCAGCSSIYLWKEQPAILPQRFCLNLPGRPYKKTRPDFRSPVLFFY